MVTYKRDLPVWSGRVKNPQFPWNYASGFLWFSPATAHISVGAEDKTVLYNICEKCRYPVLFHHLRRNNTILYQKSFSHIVPHLCFGGTSTHYLSINTIPFHIHMFTFTSMYSWHIYLSPMPIFSILQTWNCMLFNPKLHIIALLIFIYSFACFFFFQLLQYLIAHHKKNNHQT